MTLEASVPMKKISDYIPGPFGNDWGRGCAKCKYGIVSAPERTGAVSLYLERMVQAIDGDITFCDCQAGTRYRVSLLNRFQALKEEARKRGSATHPDIESARAAMHAGFSFTKVPPIRFVDKAQVPEAELAIESEPVP